MNKIVSSVLCICLNITELKFICNLHVKKITSRLRNHVFDASILQYVYNPAKWRTKNYINFNNGTITIIYEQHIISNKIVCDPEKKEKIVFKKA